MLTNFVKLSFESTFRVNIYNTYRRAINHQGRGSRRTRRKLVHCNLAIATHDDKMYKQAACCKNDLPYYYLTHVVNSNWLSNQGQTLAHFKDSLGLQVDVS